MKAMKVGLIGHVISQSTSYRISHKLAALSDSVKPCAFTLHVTVAKRQTFRVQRKRKLRLFVKFAFASSNRSTLN